MPITNIVSSINSGIIHFGQVESSQVTNSTDSAMNKDMRKIKYTDEELKKMIEDTRKATGWSQAEYARQTDFNVREQKLKDIKRNKSSKISHQEAISIIEVAKKVLTITDDKIETARTQLDMTIDYWFNDEDIIKTHTFACAAYESVIEVCKKRELTIPLKMYPEYKVRISDLTSEALIANCILAFQYLKEELTRKQLIFCLWLSINKVRIPVAKGGISIKDIIPIQGETITRKAFFQQIAGNGSDI